MAVPPRETDLLWPDPTTGPWHVKIWWRIQHGVPTPVGFSMLSWVGDDDWRRSGAHNNLPRPTEDVALPKIDGQVIRSLPIGAMVDASRAQLLEHLRYERDETDWPIEWQEAAAKWRDSVQPELDAVDSTRKGRDLGDQHYREVAQVYSEAVREGRPPTGAVKEHFQIEKSSAAKKVGRARERGFLPATSRGRVGPLTEEI